MSDHIDRATGVRKSEELDLDVLRPYLAQELGTSADDLEVEQFPGGHSNLTYLLKMGGREYVMRRPPFGSKVKKAHDMGREHRVLSALSAVRDWAPRPVVFCEDPSVLGADFYLMERIEGVILRRKIPDGVTVDEAKAQHLCETLLDTLVDLHSLDVDEVGLDDLGRPEGYVERQVTGWAKRYEGSKTDDIPQMPEVARWLADHMPPSPAACIIHNDYKFDNVVYDSIAFDRIVGVLDWEMATVGDPLMDLGTTLAYWIQADDDPLARATRRQPTHLPGMLTRDEVVDYYCLRTGRTIDHWAFYEVYGLFRLAVIAQQIYYRYHHKQTRNPAFRNLWVVIHYLYRRCRGIIRRVR